ncbi:MAG: response regulator [Actinomycetota bacterium]
MITVLVVDDEALVRAGFRMVLDAQPDIEVIGESADGAEAVAAARELRPDVVLMDVRMPVMDGLEATRAILAEPQPPRVIVLTTFDQDEYVYDALQSGASGFLLKDTPPEELAEAVRVVAAGEAVLHPSVTRTVVEGFAGGRATRDASPDRAVGDLTERELEVFKLMALAMSNAEIAEALHISETTAKTHVAHILMKLDLRDRAQAVVRAYESGVVRPGS